MEAPVQCSSGPTSLPDWDVGARDPRNPRVTVGLMGVFDGQVTVILIGPKENVDLGQAIFGDLVLGRRSILHLLLSGLPVSIPGKCSTNF